MHELGLAESILTIVGEHVPANRQADVRRVRVVVGDLAGVLGESLVFCFDALAPLSPFPQASLAIEPVPGRDLRVADIELHDDGVAP